MIKDRFGKLNIYHKCSVLSGLFLLLISLALIPLYFFNYMDIPLGIILGGSYGVVIYFITGLFENKRGEYYKWAIVISVLRFFVFAFLLVLTGLCYYILEIKIFNIFSVVGGYLVCVVVLVLLFIQQNKKERKIDGSI